MTATEFSKISKSIPVAPGIYKYFDAQGKLLYVGKAKNLKKRVSSYFIKNKTNYKTIELVNRIHKIEFTIVNSEQDAFLLENSLIKEYQPIFNINLKDDKTYPFIVVKNEAFPRVFFTRKKINDGSTYFGPYTSVSKVREFLELIKRNIPLRNCKLNLSEKNIKAGKFKVCLEYHLGNCKGPCEGLQSEEDYADGIARLSHLLKGNLQPVFHYLKEQVKLHSQQLSFEKAAYYQSKINDLKNYQSSSAVVNTQTGTVDVFSIMEEGDTAFVNYLAVNNGAIIQTQTISLQKKLDETPGEILPFAIARLRKTFESDAQELIIPFPISYPQEGITLTIPKAGNKKKLLDLSIKNTQFFIQDFKSKKALHLEEEHEHKSTAYLKELQQQLSLPVLPMHIECFDNSNFQGSFPVAAMVCFKNGLPSKKDYRHYNIKSVEGINDFASMAEVVHRRYKRVLAEKLPLPQLVIIDGGKGQLAAAWKSIVELGLNGKTTLIGLAKKQEEIFFVGDKEPVHLPWDSEGLKLIRRIRDEVHRFGISFHRQKRSKGALKNELEDIKGIGKQTLDALLKHFKSVKKIKAASLDELEKIVGTARAALIKDHK